MAGPVPDKRDLVIDQEVVRNAGVTEQLGKKLGGVANFLMNQQLIRDDFKANGPYRLGVGSVGLDGILIFPGKVEILYIAMSNQKVGHTGTTIFDIEWLDGPGSNQGSIFSVLPELDITSLDEAYMLTDVINDIDIVTVTGGINPRVSKSQFLQGEAISCKLTSGMSGAQDAQINIFYRPIT